MKARVTFTVEIDQDDDSLLYPKVLRAIRDYAKQVRLSRGELTASTGPGNTCPPVEVIGGRVTWHRPDLP